MSKDKKVVKLNKYKTRSNLMEFLRVNLHKDFYDYLVVVGENKNQQEFELLLTQTFEGALREAVEMTTDKKQKENFTKYYIGCSFSIYEFPTFDILLNEEILDEQFSDIMDDDCFALEHEFNEVIHHFLENCGMPLTFHTIDLEELDQ